MYTLILITALLPGHLSGGGNISASSVYGFATKEACLDAGSSVSIPKSESSWSVTKMTFSCVKMGV